MAKKIVKVVKKVNVVSEPNKPQEVETITTVVRKGFDPRLPLKKQREFI